MIRKLTKTFVAAALMFGSMAAYGFTYEGLTYNILSTADKTCMVVKGAAAYADTVIIPSKAIYNGEEYTVTTIGDNAFDLCTNLKAITFPETLKEIRTAAFFKTTALKSVTALGKEPADISSSPFASVIYTGSILHVPDGCWLAYQKAWTRFIYVNENGYFSTTVDGMNFDIFSPSSKYARLRGNKYTGDFVVPASITVNGTDYKVVEVGSYAFDGCGEITSITLPEGLLAINSYAFRKTNKLATMKLPSTVQFVATGLFNASTAIKEVDMNCVGITRVENVTFQNCTALEKVILPPNCIYLGASCFSGCKALTTLSNTDQLEVIMSAVFQDTPNCKFNLPSKLTTLENTAFKNSGVVFTEYPKTLKKIDGSTFYGCNNLTSVTIPGELDMLGASCFAYCQNLESVVLPEKTPATVGISVFAYCPKLKNVTLPKDIVKMTAQMFLNDTSLVAVKMPETVEEFHNYVFRGCKNLQNFTLPSKTRSIASGVFQDCSSLTEMTIPESVVSPVDNLTFGAQMFYNCSNLKKVRLSSGIEFLGGNTFGNCTNLTTIEGLENIKVIANGAFLACTSLTEFVMPPKTTTLYNTAFKNCTNLKSITMSESLDSIAKQAFLNCSALTEITIPASVRKIMDQAFSGCSGLKKVTVNGTTPPYLVANGFDEATYTSAVLDVKDSSAFDAYQTAEGWSQFVLKISSGVKEIEDSEPAVYGGYGEIIAPADAKAYTMQGVRVGLTGCPAGIYVVVSNGKTYKVAVH